MSSSFLYIQTCDDITEKHLSEAVANPDNTASFLRRVRKISQPNSGVGKLLYMFARLALSDQMMVFRRQEYERFSITVTRNRDDSRRFDVRFVVTAGLEGQAIHMTTVYCVIEDFLEAARDSAKMAPFTCTRAREDFLIFEATEEMCQESIPPPEYRDAQKQQTELEVAFSGAVVDGNDHMVGDENQEPPINDRLHEARRDDRPLTSLLVDQELAALAERSGQSDDVPGRRKFDSLAEAAQALAGAPDESHAHAVVMGRVRLKKVTARALDGLPPEHDPLRDRPITERPPGIEEDDDPHLPVVTADGVDDVRIKANPSMVPLPIVTPNESKAHAASGDAEADSDDNNLNDFGRLDGIDEDW